jgi:stress-induced-phosphoprotein 1
VKQKLRESPKTKAYMEDPAYVKIIDDLGKDTQTLVKHMSDNRVIDALAVLLDVDISVPDCTFSTCIHSWYYLWGDTVW